MKRKTPISASLLKRAATQIVRICSQLHQRHLLASADGNVSVRLTPKLIAITPSGVNKAFIKPDQIAVVSLDNEVIQGQASSERLMHLAVYRHCPEAQAVVHAHPPTAIAWSVAQPHLKELPADALSELILSMGRLPIVPYTRPGTAKMGEVLLPFLPECRALILARHGALTWGESLDEAYNGMERVEHSAQILASAQTLGGITHMPTSEVRALQELRNQIGPRLL